MKKILCVLSILMTLGVYQTAYAISPDEILVDNAELLASYQDDYPMPFSLAPKIDYSRLGGVLTVELSGYNADTVLLVGEYTADDEFLKAHIVYDVKDKNPINVTGSYEKIFLWELPSMYMQCESVSTKCDYEIVEGAEGEWEVSEDGHTLYNYTGDDTEVVIPNSYLGKRINIVQNSPAILAMSETEVLSNLHLYNVFNKRTDITSVTVSEGIKVIGNCAFSNCTQLSGEVLIPDSVYGIGAYAYFNCNKLTGGLDLSNVTKLQPYAFYLCQGLDGTLTLPSVSTIGQYTFAECKNLKGSLVIPEGVSEIGNGAFAQSRSDGDGFTALTLPSTLKKIGMGAFQYQISISNELILPEGLEYIGDFAFNHCTKFSNTVLDIPKSLKIIGGDYNVSQNTGYGSHVFYEAFRNLEAFNANSQYFKSEDGVLYSADITRLVAYPRAKAGTAFAVPEGVVQFDEMSLSYTKVTDLTLPDSFIIGDVPQNVVNKMANNLAVAFYHYNNIRNVWTKETNTRYASNDGIIYSKDGKDLWYVPTKKTGIITVSDGTENIRKGAFYIENSSPNAELYTGIHIPQSVMNIDENNITSFSKKTLQITVDENNQYYEVADGKIKEKTQ